MGDGVPKVAKLGYPNPNISDERISRHPIAPERPILSPDDARRTIEYPIRTRGPSHIIDEKPRMTTEMKRNCKAFKQLVGRLKNGEPAKDNTSLRRNVATVNYIKKNFDKVPQDVKDSYRNARNAIIEFFVNEADKRGHLKSVARVFIKSKLKKNPKEGIEGLHYLLKRGLDG